MKKPKVLAISGSTKQQSTSLSILSYIKETFNYTLELVIYNKLASLPHFNPDIKEADLPQEVKELRELILSADGVLFCTPEYVFSLPGSLKNVIEWQVATTLFSAKPVAIIVAAASGDAAFESLSLILTTIEAQLPNSSKLLVKGAKGKISAEGSITDHALEAEIKKVIGSLIQTITSGANVATKYMD